jgi:hypothetical protein
MTKLEAIRARDAQLGPTLPSIPTERGDSFIRRGQDRRWLLGVVEKAHALLRGSHPAVDGNYTTSQVLLPMGAVEALLAEIKEPQ